MTGERLNIFIRAAFSFGGRFLDFIWKPLQNASRNVSIVLWTHGLTSGFHWFSLNVLSAWSAEGEGHKKVCAIRYTDPWSLIWAQQEQGTDIAAHQ